MVKRIFLDVESVPPDEECRSLLSPAIIRGLCKKGRHTSDDRQEAAPTRSSQCTDEQFRLLALHAEYGRLLCIGLIVEYDCQIIHRGVLGRDRSSGQFHLNEGRTLRAWWNLLKEFNPNRDLVIGHNIMDFDLPFIIKRSRIKRVRPTITFNFARYRSAPIYDTMREWAHWNPHAPHISLSHLAEVLGLGIAKTEGVDGSRVYDEFLAGNHKLIAEYCLQDVEIVRAIFYRMVFADTPEPRKESDT